MPHKSTNFSRSFAWDGLEAEVDDAVPGLFNLTVKRREVVEDYLEIF
jgi:hypothetical protein